ncbi:transcriptional regulator [Wielerella bovis]|uniref:transcriptional regulator n=1 Tax=Wielerella bovis TaxID=2917790 RepID=UPI002018C9B1|nr:Cro/CI family transcriptional regulator [Wielerella bovis]ULJ59759.1 helix-turn-helix domain-containing protein [Wielerella bovis]ULJ64195.1 helix-turn-helix domain-containing protein [Wielerella bovis]ULJ67890.1 helix-turn-helix domain-containing protein [Wielerella bovis]
MNGVQKMIEHFGSQAKAAKDLAVTRQTVNSWVKGRNRIPAEKVILIEEKTGISRRELRPDLWNE